jgi:hypothetical protein
MELVYPIYLDTPMMNAFLASLEGGILEEANVESKTSKAKETSGKVSFGAKVSNVISALADINAQADLSRKVSDNLESQYKGTVRFPNASLFIRLRNLLIEREIIKEVITKSEFDKVSVGDIVEIQGMVKPSPNYELRKALNQLLPIIIPTLELQAAQSENELASIKNYPTRNNKGKKEILIGDESFDYFTAVKGYEEQVRQQQNLLVNVKAIERVSNSLFAEETIHNIIFNSDSFNAICKVYPTFARNEQISEMFEAKWRCVGKIIGKLEKNESFDLFKGLPIGLLTKSQEIIDSLKNEEVEINPSERVISGPTLIIAVLAIFA